jgi:AcrR family transcriptional regulator
MDFPKASQAMSEKNSKGKPNSLSVSTGIIRARKRANTENKIIQAARACFERVGVAKTSLQEVAAEAGISRPLLYQFFANRQALLDAMINKEIADTIALQARKMKQHASFVEMVIEGSILGVGLARRDNILMDLIEHSSIKHWPTLLLDPTQPAHHIVFDWWRPVFEKARQTGELRSNLKDHDLMEWIMSMHYMFLLRDDVSPRRMRELLALFITPAFK